MKSCSCNYMASFLSSVNFIKTYSKQCKYKTILKISENLVDYFSTNSTPHINPLSIIKLRLKFS